MPESSKAPVHWNKPVAWNTCHDDRVMGFTYGQSQKYKDNWEATFGKQKPRNWVDEAVSGDGEDRECDDGGSLAELALTPRGVVSATTFVIGVSAVLVMTAGLIGWLWSMIR